MKFELTPNKIYDILDTLPNNLSKDDFVSFLSIKTNIPIEFMDGSLSNYVVKIGDYIIKYNPNNNYEHMKMKTEFNYYKKICKICHLSKNALLFEYEKGVHINMNEVKEFDILHKIHKNIQNLNSLELDFEVPINDLVKKYKKNASKIIHTLNNFGLNNELFDEAIKFYSLMKMTLTHSDLNENNILIENSKVKFIDFGNLSYSPWIYEYIVFILNWDLDKTQIDFILLEILGGFEFSGVWPALAIYAIDIFNWNNSRSSNIQNKNKAEKIKQRIFYLKSLISEEVKSD